MKKTMKVIAAAAVASLPFFAAPASSQDVPNSVKARQAVMLLNNYYLAILGNMASGKTEYNAELAVASANSLKLIEADGIDQSTMWEPGTSTAELGDVTRAKPEIWSTWPAIMEQIEGVKTAIDAMAESAGTLDGLKSTIGGVGKACAACHEGYRTGGG